VSVPSFLSDVAYELQIVSVPSFLSDVAYELQIESMVKAPAYMAGACATVNKFPFELLVRDTDLNAPTVVDALHNYGACIACPFESIASLDEEDEVNAKATYMLARREKGRGRDLKKTLQDNPSR